MYILYLYIFIFFYILYILFEILYLVSQCGINKAALSATVSFTLERCFFDVFLTNVLCRQALVTKYTLFIICCCCSLLFH